MDIDVFALPVHPAADIFPMLAEDELNDLAEDIRGNGLQNPLVVSDVGGVFTLIDGRNRREASRRAGIVPEFRTIPAGVEPEAVILSENILRRHMTKGQRAMAVAMMFPDPTRLKRGRSLIFKDQERINGGYLSQARTVLSSAPELAKSVLSGSQPLSNAYEEAKRRKEKAESRESKLERLKTRAPDLADLVVEERMSLEEAEAACNEREKVAKLQREATMKNLRSAIYGFGGACHTEAGLRDILSAMIDFREEFEEVTQRPADDAIACLRAIETAVTTILLKLEEAYGH